MVFSGPGCSRLRTLAPRRPRQSAVDGTPSNFLRRSGYATLLIDFQATGESVGDAITFGWRERFDVLAAVQFLNARMPGRPVAVVAVSLGGAATLLATPPLDVQAAVLEAVYPSVDRALLNRLRMRIGPFGPAVVPVLLAQLGPRLGVTAADLKPVEHIAVLGCPLLIVGGTLDQHTTIDDTRLLYSAAREPKELWLIQAPLMSTIWTSPAKTIAVGFLRSWLRRSNRPAKLPLAADTLMSDSARAEPMDWRATMRQDRLPGGDDVVGASRNPR
jgi:fermentation-respiration switch protein FrsA (DUF1100 family)